MKIYTIHIPKKNQTVATNVSRVTDFQTASKIFRFSNLGSRDNSPTVSVDPLLNQDNVSLIRSIWPLTELVLFN